MNDRRLYILSIIICFACLVRYVATSVVTTFDFDAAELVRRQLHSCIHNCALCVKTWEVGLYNGKRCAKRCLRNGGRRLPDPDCTKTELFNYNAQTLTKYRNVAIQVDREMALRIQQTNSTWNDAAT